MLGESSIGVESLESRMLLASSIYAVTNLVSNGAVPAAHTDKNLVNPWGIAVGDNGIRVADADAGVLTAYNGNGKTNGPVIKVEATEHGESDESEEGGDFGHPTGIVFNSHGGFNIKGDDGTASSRFLFVTEDGGIHGYAKNADKNEAVLVIDNSGAGASYKGVALGKLSGKWNLYAANFAKNKIEVYDDHFKKKTLAGSFKDSGIPSGYGPFNVQELNGKLHVTFAKHEEDSADEEAHGSGLGFVDVFNNNGTFVRRLATRGALNAPWGLAIAPNGFGQFSGDVLVGNFGDGRINAYSPSGKFLGPLMKKSGSTTKAIKIDGLWGIAFGNGQNGARADRLYFAAGINDEADGLFGSVKFAGNAPAAASASASASIFSSAKTGDDLKSVLD